MEFRHLHQNEYEMKYCVYLTSDIDTNVVFYNELRYEVRKWLNENIGIFGKDYHFCKTQKACILVSQRRKMPAVFYLYFRRFKDSTAFKLAWS